MVRLDALERTSAQPGALVQSQRQERQSPQYRRPLRPGKPVFELFLDETMAYSCGIFSDGDASLLQASTAKFDAACSTVDLKADQHLLEIGTGWGGLAIHAARHYGCRVTTTTISREQYEFAKERVARGGLSDRVTLLLEDYRDRNGKYDALVSIEMIEAVGYQYLDTYFRAAASF